MIILDFAVLALMAGDLNFAREFRIVCGVNNGKLGYSVCGRQVPCHRLTGGLVRCNHPGDPKALNK
jgi:hypothetical protein